MNTVIFAALAAYASAGAAFSANRACVANSGAYELYWWFTDLSTGIESINSDTYKVDKIRCMDLNSSTVYGIQNGDYVSVSVHALLGETNEADTGLVY